ncbi:hypothetical protein SDC9_171349 [bioreactor metagenome]|uniref:Coenzyme PQQ synthesis protein D n=1 Tax=bioreactor metagenome TaxID=1076179 RepID=A0A645GCU8_9ZZZZ
MKNAVLNPEIVYREDFDDWALLFDADTAETYGLNEVSSFIWKKLDGNTSVEDLVSQIKEEFDEVPDNTPELVQKFLDSLEEKGLIGYKESV